MKLLLTIGIHFDNGASVCSSHRFIVFDSDLESVSIVLCLHCSGEVFSQPFQRVRRQQARGISTTRADIQE